MAVADAHPPPWSIAQQLRRWVWLLAYMLASMAVAVLVPAQLPSADTLTLRADASQWVLSAGMQAQFGAAATRWRGGDVGPFHASRVIEVPADSDFIALRACLDAAADGESVALMLASVSAAGGLDFNRHYRMWGVGGSARGECIEDRMARHAGDGRAIVQLQLLKPGAELALAELQATPLKITGIWRRVQPAMLGLGILLLVLLFRDYLRARPWLLAFAGLGTVAGIVFGCTVSVGLKADIYALLTGGRSVPGVSQTPTLAELLQVTFPLGGFSIFTYLHAVLFAAATFFLSLVRRRAWLDMLLLATATETLQIFVPGRGPGFSDVLVDWSGIAAALLLLAILRRSQRVRLLLEKQGIDKDIAGL